MYIRDIRKPSIVTITNFRVSVLLNSVALITGAKLHNSPIKITEVILFIEINAIFCIIIIPSGKKTLTNEVRVYKVPQGGDRYTTLITYLKAKL